MIRDNNLFQCSCSNCHKIIQVGGGNKTTASDDEESIPVKESGKFE